MIPEVVPGQDSHWFSLAIWTFSLLHWKATTWRV